MKKLLFSVLVFSAAAFTTTAFGQRQTFRYNDSGYTYRLKTGEVVGEGVGQLYDANRYINDVRGTRRVGTGTEGHLVPSIQYPPHNPYTVIYKQQVPSPGAVIYAPGNYAGSTAAVKTRRPTAFCYSSNGYSYQC